MRPGVVEEVEDPVVLRAVLDRAEAHARLGAGAHPYSAGVGGQGPLQRFVDVSVDVEAFDRQADLAAVGEGSPEQLLGDGRDVDVREDDGGVVAAQFQGDAGQGGRRAGHDLAAGPGGAGIADHVDAGVFRHSRPEPCVARHDVQHAGREHVTQDLADLQRGQGRERRRLPHHGVAREQGRSELEPGVAQGVVPRHDRPDDTQRDTVGDGETLRAVLVDRLRQRQRSRPAQPVPEPEDLAGDVVQALSLLSGEEPLERLKLRLDSVGDRQDKLAALLERSGRPAGKRCPGCGHGLVQLLGRADGRPPRDGLVGRIEHVVFARSRYRDARDRHGEASSHGTLLK